MLSFSQTEEEIYCGEQFKWEKARLSHRELKDFQIPSESLFCPAQISK